MAMIDAFVRKGNLDDAPQYWHLFVALFCDESSLKQPQREHSLLSYSRRIVSDRSRRADVGCASFGRLFQLFPTNRCVLKPFNVPRRVVLSLDGQ